MIKKISLASCTIAVGLSLAACASISATSNGSKVIISPNKPPHGCRYVGQVTGNQGNLFTGVWTSNKNLEQGAMNDLKNKAARLGGNYVQMITNRAGSSGSFKVGLAQTNVTETGNVYRCPPKSIDE